MRDWSDSTLGERVKHLAELRGVSLNALGAKAGIASGPMSRLARKTEKVASSPQTLVQIANAWAASSAWLAFGEGQPELEGDAAPERVVELEARYPNLLEAIEWLKSRGKLSTSTEKTGRTIALSSPTDLEVETWVTMLGDIERQTKAASKGKSTARPYVETDEDVPPISRG